MILFQKKRLGWTGGDRRGASLLFLVLEEGAGLNRRWSKGSIVVIYCIGGRDRVEPEVIEWEFDIILLKYAWMYVCDIQYMDVVIYVIWFMDAVIYVIWYNGVAIYDILYIDAANYDTQYMDMIVYDIWIMDVAIYGT